MTIFEKTIKTVVAIAKHPTTRKVVKTVIIIVVEEAFANRGGGKK